MKTLTLGNLKSGINRLRVKGSPSPDSLYDLLNGYIDESGSARSRPGTVTKYTLPAGTTGLAFHSGKKHVFADTVIASGFPNDVIVNVLKHPGAIGAYKPYQYPPDWPDASLFDPNATLTRIHYVQPFLGYLYVVAEFTDGFTFHYWLRTGHSWQANTAYYPNNDVDNDLPVAPTAPNGYIYNASFDGNIDPWKAGILRSVSDTVVPTSKYQANNPETKDFKYMVMEAIGNNPISGDTEPAWPVVAGSIVYEYSEVVDGVFTIIPWQASHIYDPGDLVIPLTVPAPSASPVLNDPSFESGSITTGWLNPSGYLAVASNAGAYDGGYICELVGLTSAATYFADNITYLDVTPGNLTTVSCKARHYGADSSSYRTYVSLTIKWYVDNLGSAPINTDTMPEMFLYADDTWLPASFSATAPATAKYARIGFGLRNANAATSAVDAFSVVTGYDQPPFQFAFQAIQAAPASSDATEPAWTSTLGSTVVDGAVTWKAVYPNRITWQAYPLLVSGGPTAPVFPAAQGATVADNTITWTASVQRITDLTCPQSKAVCIAASKVYAANGGIINYSATVNPLVWNTEDAPGDAGYIPFGLQKFGSNPVAAMNLYRSNLACFNAEGFQMWQVDADPANISLLDALPVGCSQQHSIAPVVNDLFFLSSHGVRSLAVSAASNSMEAKGVGEPIDPLVTIISQQATTAFHDVGRGQYLLAFSGYPVGSSTVFVFTTSSKSWSRYVFPFDIDYFCQVGDELYFRSGDNIMAFNENAIDDSGIAFLSVVQWPWLSLGDPGGTKSLQGVDLVGISQPTLSVGPNENDITEFYSVGTLDADTVPGFMVPIQFMGPSFSFKLSYAGTPWRLLGMNVYFSPMRPTS